MQFEDFNFKFHIVILLIYLFACPCLRSVRWSVVSLFRRVAYR